MALIGTCKDCGARAVLLRYKPETPVSEQSRPSVCDECRSQREARATSYVRCEDCGDRVPEARATGLDVSPPDEYYPEFIHFCPGCAPSDDAEQTEGSA
jgi:hypothetical protein